MTYLVSDVDVITIACAQIGVPPPSSIDDTAMHIVILKGLWPAARRDVLFDSMWVGAKKTVQLNLYSQSPIARWAYKFAIPANCIRELKINGMPVQAGGDLWEIELNAEGEYVALYTNATQVFLEYIKDVPNVAHLRPKLMVAMGYALAAMAAPRFKLNDQYVMMLEAKAKRKIAEAIGMEGQIGSPQIQSGNDSLVNERF
jgi:hypothetical protein